MELQRKKNRKTNGYWFGQVDTLIATLSDDLKEIRQLVQDYMKTNAEQHEKLQSSINGLKFQAAKWGGAAGIVIAIGTFLALVFLSQFGVKIR